MRRLPARPALTRHIPFKPRGLRGLLCLALATAMASAWGHGEPPAAAAATASPAAQGAPADTTRRYTLDTTPTLLSKQVLPEHYSLQFTLDPAADTFEAQGEIELQVRQPTRQIVLHAAHLQAGSAHLVGPDGARRTLHVQPQPEVQRWALTADAPIEPARYRLQIAWKGRVNPVGEGLFRVGKGREASLHTQLQAIHARTLFPAFDEPVFRARFTLEVRAPAGLQVYSNMPLLAEEATPEAGWRRHRFATTPSMTPYLVALTVGRFDALEGTAAGKPVRILTPPGRRDEATYALQATQQLLPYYEQYFGTLYALPKLDQVAVQGVRSGAMEDWGLISYHERFLLFNSARQPEQAKQWIFNLMAHEIAHQWFGNLVTTAHWNDIWLNEAFATWMASRATEHFNPAWHLELQSRARLEEAFAKDAGPATRAIRGGAVSEASIADVFDSITYDKGGAVLSMVEQMLGPENFRQGMQRYMRAHAMSNATAADLWHHLGPEVQRVAQTWTDQSGHPLLSVQQRCVGEHTEITLAQQQFQPRHLAPDSGAPGRRWAIPVHLTHAQAPAQTVLLEGASRQLRLPDCGSPWLANADGLGFYRVGYDAATWHRLRDALPTLPAHARVTLAGDLWAQVQAGHAPLALWLNWMAAFAAVDDASRPALFRLASTSMHWMLRAAEGDASLYGRLQALARSALGPELARLGLEARPGLTPAEEALRGSLIQTLRHAGDPAATQALLQRYGREDLSAQQVPAALRAAYLQALGWHADGPMFDRLQAALASTKRNDLKRQYATALAMVQDDALAHRALMLTLTDQITGDDARTIYRSMAYNPRHARRAYAFAQQHWPALAARTDDGPFGGRQGILPEAAIQLNRREDADALLVDQRAATGPAGESRAQETAQNILWKAAWREGAASALPPPR